MAGRGIYTGPGSSRGRDFVSDKKGSRSDYNLLSLTGGTYKLQSNDEWQELYRLLAADYQSGRPNFFVQRKTAIFPLTFDIDFKHSQHGLQWLIDQIIPAVCRGLLNTLATECTKVSFVLTTAPSTPCEMGEGEQGYKSGAHVHFLYARSKENGRLLDVIVDEEGAMAVRQSCIAELIKQHGDGMDWDNIMDPTVLEKNGESDYNCQNCTCIVCSWHSTLLCIQCRSQDAFQLQSCPMWLLQEAYTQPGEVCRAMPNGRAVLLQMQVPTVSFHQQCHEQGFQ